MTTSQLVGRSGVDATAGTGTLVLHDQLSRYGHPERVAVLLARHIGGGAVTTAAYLPERAQDRHADIRVHELLPHLPTAVKRSARRLAPLAAAAFGGLQVNARAVLCSTSGWSHWAATQSPSLVYCHGVALQGWPPDPRILDWPRPAVEAAAGLRRVVRRADRYKALAPRFGAPRRFVAASEHVRRQIRDAYGLESDVIAPPAAVEPDGPLRPVPDLPAGFVLAVDPADGSDDGFEHTVRTAFAPGEFGQLVVLTPHARRTGPSGCVREVTPVDDAQLRWLYHRSRAVLNLSGDDATPEALRFGRPTLVRRGVTGPAVLGIEGADVAAVRRALRTLGATPWDAGAIRAGSHVPSTAEFLARITRALAELTGADDSGGAAQ